MITVPNFNAWGRLKPQHGWQLHFTTVILDFTLGEMKMVNSLLCRVILIFGEKLARILSCSYCSLAVVTCYFLLSLVFSILPQSRSVVAVASDTLQNTVWSFLGFSASTELKAESSRRFEASSTCWPDENIWCLFENNTVWCFRRICGSLLRCRIS